MQKPLKLAIILPFVLAGCSVETSEVGLDEAATGRVFGGPVQHELFEPFQGEWRFENRTFEPESTTVGVSGGPDLSIDGHIIRFGSGILISEIRLCQVRATDEGIKCEGWHHEDIHDPGDMSRVDCKLRRNGEKLELHWRMVSSEGFSDDPVIAAPNYSPPKRIIDPELSPWWIETYSPKPAQ